MKSKKDEATEKKEEKRLDTVDLMVYCMCGMMIILGAKLIAGPIGRMLAFFILSIKG